MVPEVYSQGTKSIERKIYEESMDNLRLLVKMNQLKENKYFYF